MLPLLLACALARAQAPAVDTPYRVGVSSPQDGALVIGVERYLRLPAVPYAARDAQVFYDLMVSTRGIPADRVRLLTADASRERIDEALVDLGRRVGPGGTAWVYFAGHGSATLDTGEPLLLGDDVAATPESFTERGIPVAEAALTAGKGGGDVILVVDACFGGVGRTREALLASARFAVPSYSSSSPRTLTWLAAGPNEASVSADAIRHGVFTFLATGALRGWADGEKDGKKDGMVTAEEARLYVQRALSAAQVVDQHPVLFTEGAADPVLMRGVSEAAPPITAALLTPTARVSRVQTGVSFDKGESIVNAVVDDTGFLVVRASPPEATIWLNGEELGQGYVQVEKMVGRYVVWAEAGLYHPARQPIELGTKGARVELTLTPAWGGVRITSDPAGAEVWLDGEKVGKTPWIADRKPSGSHEVRLVLADHLTRAETLVVEDGKQAVLEARLERNRGSLDLASVPPGARVWVAGQDTGLTTPTVLADLPAGVVEVRLRLEGYGEVVRTPTVVRGSTVRVDVPMPAKPGILAILAVDEAGRSCEGDVTLDGEPRGRTPLKLEIPARTYEVAVACPGGTGAARAEVIHNEKTQVVVPTGTAPLEARPVLPRILGWSALGAGGLAAGSVLVSYLTLEPCQADPDPEVRRQACARNQAAVWTAEGTALVAAGLGVGAWATWRW